MMDYNDIRCIEDYKDIEEMKVGQICFPPDGKRYRVIESIDIKGKRLRYTLYDTIGRRVRMVDTGWDTWLRWANGGGDANGLLQRP